MRRIYTFSKRLITVVVTFTIFCALICLIGQFYNASFEGMFIACMGSLGGEVLTYCVKAFFSKREEEKNKLMRDLQGDENDGMD